VLLENAEIDRICQETANSLVGPLTEQLRMMAFSSGWPANLIKQISVKVAEDFTLYVDGIDEDVEDVEYGSLNSLPNAAIRPFMLRAHFFINKEFEDVLVPKLLEQLGMF
jgi:hypothetical protein